MIFKLVDKLPDDIIQYIKELVILDDILELFSIWYKKWSNKIFNTKNINIVSIQYKNLFLLTSLPELVYFNYNYKRFTENKEIREKIKEFCIIFRKKYDIKLITIDKIVIKLYNDINNNYSKLVDQYNNNIHTYINDIMK